MTSVIQYGTRKQHSQPKEETQVVTKPVEMKPVVTLKEDSTTSTPKKVIHAKSEGLCIATKKDGKRCGLKAKYGQYCGNHVPDKQITG
jgi:hypothetical protein